MPSEPSERRRQARRIFDQVVDLPPAAREQWLERECADDHGLRESVDRLLRADADAGDFLRDPLVRIPQTATLQAPERIGPYRLGKKIGQGGMGAVYRAVRDDEAFHRQVAVKLIAQGSLSEETRRRLQIERQLLAALDHPWIAQIFDGGTTDDGLPYMVMELIDGEPIDQYCERLDLDYEQRIEPFCKVCTAVHYSHQNLVVHCDLKPSNILVTAAGEPKLLDFGIAKLLRQGSTEQSHEPTTVGSRPLTPEYASPEQLRGETLSTISDVYSLGVLLHKLLTGRRPTVGGSSRDGTDDEPIAPSVVVLDQGRAESHRLRGDLDQIMLKALRPRAEDRFGSAEQLAEDLGRYLDGFPVLARQGNMRYRAEKFLRRHRVAVVAAMIGLMILSVFAGGMAMMASRLAQERTKLQEVVGFFRLFFERAGPVVQRGRNLTLREAVDQNADMIEVGLADQPEVQVEIASVLGDIYRRLGQPEDALEWSNRALMLNRELSGEQSRSYARSLVQVGAALRELGRFDEAEARTRDGLRRLDARSDVPAAIQVASLNDLVTLYCYQERYADADTDSATALRLARQKLDHHAPQTVNATVNRGLVLRRLGRAAEAQSLYERALSLSRKTLGSPHPEVATLWLNLSSIQRDQGDIESAQSSLEEADSQFKQLFGDTHHTRIRPLVGLAKLAGRRQDPDAAVGLYAEAIRVAIVSNAQPAFVLRPAVDLARLMLEADRCAAGEASLRDTLQHCRDHADDRWRYAEVESLLGACLAQRGLTDEARELLTRGYERLRADDKVDPEVLIRARERWERLTDPVEAER